MLGGRESTRVGESWNMMNRIQWKIQWNVRSKSEIMSLEGSRVIS